MTSLTNKAVSLLSRHRPVVAERVSTSRLTRIIARMWPSHSVSAKLLRRCGTMCVLRVEAAS